MSLLRNPEVRRGLLRWAAATAVLAGAAAVWEPRAGLAVLAAGAVFTALHLAGLRRRYRQMADLSRELDSTIQRMNARQRDMFMEIAELIMAHES